MPLVDPSHPLADLLERDGRYSLDAYLFILESLSFAQDSLGMGECRQVGSKRTSKKKSERHVTGQELCEAARRYAQQQYGYLASQPPSTSTATARKRRRAADVTTVPTIQNQWASGTAKTRSRAKASSNA